MKQFYFSVSSLCILAACGGGEVTQDPQYTLSNIQVVNETHTPTKIMSYDAQQNGIGYTGYIVTNDALSFTEGLHAALSSDDVEITHVINQASNSFTGHVMYQGKEYWATVSQSSNGQETILAVPVEFEGHSWRYGDDVAFFDDAVIRVLGGPMASVSSTGSATFRGGVSVIGGGGYAQLGAELEVDFDSSSAVLTTSSNNSSAPTIYAEIDINNADGSFSSDLLSVSFSQSIFDPQVVRGHLQGNFTGNNQDGGLGAIWSAEGEPQFKGLLSLTRTQPYSDQ